MNLCKHPLANRRHSLNKSDSYTEGCGECGEDMPARGEAASPSKPTNPKDAAALDCLPLHLVPDSLAALVALAFAEGAVKYTPYNWREAGVSACVYVSACRRHLAAWFNGEEGDPATGTPHLGAAAACLAVIIDAQVAGALRDDRPVAAPVGALQRDLASKVADIRARTRALQPDPPPAGGVLKPTL